MARVFSLCLLFPLSMWAMLVGNPGQPGLQSESVFKKKSSWWSFRTAYIDDNIYQQRFRDEFKIDPTESSRTDIKLSTFAGLLTLNLKNRIDFYGIVGSSRIQIDEEIFTKRRLAWGVGSKLIVFQESGFRFGIDGKYFETDQVPTFFVSDNLPYNVLTDFRLKYCEVQAAAGLSYTAWIFSPYVNATYLISKIEPQPYITLVRLPDSNTAVDVVSKSIISQKRWGMALGLTLIDQCRATLAVEWRLFNQNAVDINGEIRF